MKGLENVEVGYKVVRQTREKKLVSLVVKSKNQTHYPFKKWAERPVVNGKRCGPLTVFKSKAEAQDFITAFNWVSISKIYLCLYVPNKRCKSIWNWSYGQKMQRELKRLPEGTVLAERVLLLKKLGATYL